MKFKRVLTWSPTEKKIRLFRLHWERGLIGDGNGYSAMFTLGVVPRFFQWWSGFYDWKLTVLGVVFHYKRSYGGRLV